ncbi:MAG: TVP38/TMEM64 family protein [bacterium]
MVNNQNKNSKKYKNIWKPLIFLGILLIIILLARIFNIGEQLDNLRDWIESFGTLGIFIFLGIYIIAVVAAIPGSALTIAAGALFGSVIGVITVSIGSTVGASLAFLIGRYFARDAVAGWLAKSEKFAKLDLMTEKHGAFIVALTRLFPIFPFNMLNYGFGLTKVKFWTYVLWSWLCMLPGTMVYVIGSDAIVKTTKSGVVPLELIGILVGAVTLLAVLVRFASKKLKSNS